MKSEYEKLDELPEEIQGQMLDRFRKALSDRLLNLERAYSIYLKMDPLWASMISGQRLEEIEAYIKFRQNFPIF